MDLHVESPCVARPLHSNFIPGGLAGFRRYTHCYNHQPRCRLDITIRFASIIQYSVNDDTQVPGPG